MRKAYKVIYEAPTSEQRQAIKAKYPTAVCLWRTERDYHAYDEDAQKLVSIFYGVDPEEAVQRGLIVKEFSMTVDAFDRGLHEIVKADCRVVISDMPSHKEHITIE